MIICDIDDTLVQARSPEFYAQYSNCVERAIADYFQLDARAARRVANFYRETRGGGQYALYAGDVAAIYPENALKDPNYDILHTYLAGLNPAGRFVKQDRLARRLRDIRRHGIIVVALTSSPTSLAKRILRSSGYLVKDFDTIIGYEPDGIPPKMRRDGAIFTEISRRFGISLSQVLAVGDTPDDDVIPAVACGARGCVVGALSYSFGQNDAIPHYPTTDALFCDILKEIK